MFSRLIDDGLTLSARLAWTGLQQNEHHHAWPTRHAETERLRLAVGAQLVQLQEWAGCTPDEIVDLYTDTLLFMEQFA